MVKNIRDIKLFLQLNSKFNEKFKKTLILKAADVDAQTHAYNKHNVDHRECCL
jgi:hypothetical protein